MRTLSLRQPLALIVLSPCVFVLACSSGEGDVEGTGGGVSVSGGAPSTGGDSSASGGEPGSGGALSTGGSSTGGVAAGGTLGVGGEVAAVGGANGLSGGADGAGGTPGAGGEATGGAEGSGGGSSVQACPSDAVFCSGFDDAELPEGAVFKLNGDPATPWTQYFEVDTSVMNSGASSLRVKSVTESSGAYKMLAVPSGGATFWARFYLRSDAPLGELDHNVFAQASGSDEPNDGTSVEFAEDVGLAFNSSDSVRWPEDYGRIGGDTNPYTLAPDAWYCVELFFDGAAQQQMLYIDGELLIDAMAFPDATKAFTVLKFGYNALHGTSRTTWYDDVAVGPTRPGCL